MTQYRRLAVDGIDGAGKTTTIQALEERLSLQGLRVARADRGGLHSSVIVATLTDLIKDSDGGISPLTPEASGFLRLARVRERLSLVPEADADVTLFDRWIVTDLALLPEEFFQDIKPAVSRLIEGAGGTLTVLLEAPFETTWARVLQRPEAERSSKERLGRAHNEAIFARTAVGIERFTECGGDVRRVDSTASLEVVVDEIIQLLE